MPKNIAQLSEVIASEIISQGILVSWPTLLILLAVSFLGGLAGSFISAYAKKRGEAYATKADFNLVIEQLRQTTRAAEETRGEIASSFGEAASRRVLLREKIEEFFRQSVELDHWHLQVRSAGIEGKNFDRGDSPISSMQMLQALYFREISGEVGALAAVCGDLEIWAAQSVITASQAQIERSPRPSVSMDELRPLIERFVSSQAAARRKVVELYAPQAGL
jgi:hypothetical protein